MSENAYAQMCIGAPIMLASMQLPNSSIFSKSDAQVPTTTSVKSHPIGNFLKRVPSFMVSSKLKSDIASTTATTSFSAFANSKALSSLLIDSLISSYIFSLNFESFQYVSFLKIF